MKIQSEAELLAERSQDIAKKQKEEDAKLAPSLSVRQKLERKAETDRIYIEMAYDLGTFNLTFRKLNAKQQERISELLTSEMGKAKDEETKVTLTNELYELIGNASMDDPKLDAAFWVENKDRYTYGDFLGIVMKIAAASSSPDPKYIEEIKKFRLQ